jgi:formate dehydrogenase (hydrogenase)
MTEKVLTVCPYCGAGCMLNLLVDNGTITGAEPAPGRTNQSELCLKGYYGWDFLNDTNRLTPRLKKPLIRRRRSDKFEEVSWYDAIEFASGKLMEIKHKYGPDSIMLTGSARGPGNESNYVMQKFARAVIGTNNIDHCARV